jgi:hypothetical protein
MTPAALTTTSSRPWSRSIAQTGARELGDESVETVLAPRRGDDGRALLGQGARRGFPDPRRRARDERDRARERHRLASSSAAVIGRSIVLYL